MSIDVCRNNKCQSWYSTCRWNKLMVEITLHGSNWQVFGLRTSSCWMSWDVDDCLWCGNKQRPPTENKQRLLIQNWLQQEGQPVSLTFGRDSKTGRRVAKLYSCRKKERLQVFLSGDPGPGEARRVTRRGASFVVGWGVNLAFASKTSLVLSWK